MRALQHNPDPPQPTRSAATLQDWIDDLNAQTTPARSTEPKKEQSEPGGKSWTGLTVAVTIVVMLLLLLVRIAVD